MERNLMAKEQDFLSSHPLDKYIDEQSANQNEIINNKTQYTVNFKYIIPYIVLLSILLSFLIHLNKPLFHQLFERYEVAPQQKEGELIYYLN